MSAKKLRSNKTQIKVLVDFMSTHDHLATGEFTGPLGGKRADSQWQVLKEVLREYGPDRTVEQWKQTWKDLKKQARAENAAAARAHHATGNKNTIPIVSEIGKKILNIIGHECSTGIGPAESLIGSPNQEIMQMCVVEDNILYPQPSTSSILDILPLPPPPPPPGFDDPINILPPAPPANTTPRTTRTNRRPLAEDFSRLQEENNNILQGIASSLIERNLLQQEHNSLLREQNALLAEQNRLKRMDRFSRRFSFS